MHTVVCNVVCMFPGPTNVMALQLMRILCMIVRSFSAARKYKSASDTIPLDVVSKIEWPWSDSCKIERPCAVSVARHCTKTTIPECLLEDAQQRKRLPGHPQQNKLTSCEQVGRRGSRPSPGPWQTPRSECPLRCRLRCLQWQVCQQRKMPPEMPPL